MGLTESELARTRPLEAIPTPHAMLHSLIPNAFGAQVLKHFGDFLLNVPLNPLSHFPENRHPPVTVHLPLANLT